ncbi:MAG: NADH-quinone oxidoreductase subunit NuoN [Alphaproteobacteria bacterium]|nr:NADH-quinone oxidoreductase subunit NuoN [Alphaproteobacteria bacterium]
MVEFPDINPAIAELWLALAAMALLLVGVLRGDSATRSVLWLGVLTLAVAAWLVWSNTDVSAVTFSGMYVADHFGAFAKVLILVGSALTMILSMDFLEKERVGRPEFPVLVIFASLGMMVMVAANDLLSLYVGLELQSLSLYVLATFQRDSEKSTESGLKYFVLGALASGILLYGATLVYGFTGTTSFTGIAGALASSEEQSVGILFGLAFVTAGLAFKVAAVPFHMWTPDVYEGAPTPVTAFFSLAPKVAALALFMRVMLGPFGGISDDWVGIIGLLSATSMVLGAFAAIGQRNIKRLMAYSSIGHVGYALMGLAASSPGGVRGTLVYLAIYVAMNLGAWGVILSMRRLDGGMVENVEDLAGMARSRPLLAAAMAIFLFSLAGVPPLAGFFGKFYVFFAAIDAELYLLAVIGVLATVVGSYYYLRIVQVMYFDEPAPSFVAPAGTTGAVVAVAAVFTLFFFLFPAPFVAEANLAALALFP